MNWLVQDIEGNEWICKPKPEEISGYFYSEIKLKIPTGTIERLIGKNLSHRDEPVQFGSNDTFEELLLASFVKTNNGFIPFEEYRKDLQLWYKDTLGYYYSKSIDDVDTWKSKKDAIDFYDSDFKDFKKDPILTKLFKKLNPSILWVKTCKL